LKVDQRFVLRSSTSPADETIVRTVRDLAHRLGLVAVAEGVENRELFDRMVAFEFDILQGYYWPDRSPRKTSSPPSSISRPWPLLQPDNQRADRSEPTIRLMIKSSGILENAGNNGP